MTRDAGPKTTHSGVFSGRGELTSEYSVNWVRVRVRVRVGVRVRVRVPVRVRVRVRVGVRVLPLVRVRVPVRVRVGVRPLVRKRATGFLGFAEKSPGRAGAALRETLESVSLCTRFSGFSTISKFSFN